MGICITFGIHTLLFFRTLIAFLCWLFEPLDAGTLGLARAVARVVYPTLILMAWWLFHLPMGFWDALQPIGSIALLLICVQAFIIMGHVTIFTFFR